MARFLSPGWVEEWNVALESRPSPDQEPDTGPAMPVGLVTVVQEVHGAPEGDIRLVMTIDDGSVHFELGAAAGADGEEAGGRDGPGAVADVTIVVAYDDAAAMSRGTVPAQALTAGLIRVRGDLSVLVATQQVLNDVRAGSEGRLPPTTY